ncbi:kinase-like protein [Apiospora hydei]|uniref:non-specific serine/threonine protein kinase n=1 Tax=Apiospora hydei TaxID=1337664 RepID=A0ABR1WPH4_9PEZI
MGNSQGKPVDLNGEVNLNHFRLLRVVGRGAFGKVRIVERKDTSLSFALKYIRKDEVVRSESVRNIIRERRMLEHVNHPFICNLRYSFQDIEYMYLVVDLMSGGDLRFHISRKTFTEDAVRFWIAELGCALRYVHGQGIIHRDVKPDNVLLDADGHVHLTDFVRFGPPTFMTLYRCGGTGTNTSFYQNVASDVIPGKVLTSKSGTLAYLAPEVYSGKGYTVTADWWSLGVLFYECIYNKRPFEGNSESSLSATIQAASPKWPITSPPVTLPCLYAIQAALTADPDKRMGATWDSFVRHQFFQMIDFDALERKEVEPVFVPSSDKTNFDATYDLEEQKPREKLKDDATEKEIREEELYRSIERDFCPFDYTVAAYNKLAAMQNGEGESNNGAGQTTEENAHAHGQAMSVNTAVPAMPTNGNPSQYQAGPGQQPQQHVDAHNRPHDPRQARGGPARPPPLPPYPNSYAAGHHRSQPSGMRVQSPTGGIQMTIDAAGSWSQLARQDATLPADANTAPDDKTSSSSGGGVFSIFGRKRVAATAPSRKRGEFWGRRAHELLLVDDFLHIRLSSAHLDGRT